MLPGKVCLHQQRKASMSSSVILTTVKWSISSKFQIVCPRHPQKVVPQWQYPHEFLQSFFCLALSFLYMSSFTWENNPPSLPNFIFLSKDSLFCYLCITSVESKCACARGSACCAIACACAVIPRNTGITVTKIMIVPLHVLVHVLVHIIVLMHVLVHILLSCACACVSAYCCANVCACAYIIKPCLCMC